MPYIPDAGDIVWLDISPQAGYRHAIVLSPAAYNRIGLMLCCPLTTKIKAYPFEVLLSATQPSAALADQVKSLDWRARKAQRKGKITDAQLIEIRAKARALIGK